MKFQVGEIAIYMSENEDCEILVVGPIAPGTDVGGPVHEGYGKCCNDNDYIARFPDGYHWGVLEKDLRKRHPPEEAAEKEWQEDLANMLKPKVEA